MAKKTQPPHLARHQRAHGLFSRVKEARELLKAEAENILKMYMQVIHEARLKGDMETAAKALQWLIEHMPADDEALRMIDISIDKPVQIEAKAGPTIQIGIALGGMSKPKALPEVIEVKPEDDD